MTFQDRMKGLIAAHLADSRRPDVVGFVDGLFCVAAEQGTIVGALADNDCLCLSYKCGGVSECHVATLGSRGIMRMICARLAVLCKEHSPSDVSIYGGNAEIVRPGTNVARWHISIQNTPERQEFVLEPAGGTSERRDEAVAFTLNDAEPIDGQFPDS